MAITWTIGHDFNVETQRYGHRTTEVTHEGVVLSTYINNYHVPSDNAMIDSGEEGIALIWNGTRTEEITLWHGRPSDKRGSATVDAPDEIKDLAAKFETARKTVLNILGAFHKAEKERKEQQKIKKGALVEVVAGRKVKKGTRWYVCGMGESQYGPYVNLSSKPHGLGEFARYINPDNLKVIATEKIADPYREGIRNAAAKTVEGKYGYSTDGWDMGALGMLHDMLREQGHTEEADTILPYIAAVILPVAQSAPKQEKRNRRSVCIGA